MAAGGGVSPERRRFGEEESGRGRGGESFFLLSHSILPLPCLLLLRPFHILHMAKKGGKVRKFQSPNFC